MNFKQFFKESTITEAKAIKHLQHLEDFVFLGCGEGVKQATTLLGDFLETLAAPAKQKANLNIKADGSPSVLFGSDPREGRNGSFFVGTKSVFNKRTPKLAHSHNEIDQFYDGPVAEKLHSIFDGLKKVFNEKDVILQTELLFTPGDKQRQQIDGQEHITFSPNTITYAVPVDPKSDLYKRIKNADFGIIINQQYDVFPSAYDDPIETKTTALDFSVVEKMINKAKNEGFFMTQAYRKNISSADLSLNVDNLKTELRQVDALADKLDETFCNKWVQDNPVLKTAKRFINNLVKTQSSLISGKGNYTKFKKALLNFIENDSRASGRVKETIKDMVQNEEENLKKMLKIFQMLIEIKHEILDALRELMGGKLGKTFVQTDDGLEVTDDEGFVIQSEAGIAKFVDRLEFSRRNFQTTF